MARVHVLALSRRNRSLDKPNEDAFALRLPQDGETAVFAIADGVTRSRFPDGSYPLPSGAATAARLVAETLADTLGAPGGRQDVAAAFATANRAVDLANRRNGVWDRLDFGVHDLWGAVATAVVVRGSVAQWGHIGDSTLLHLPRAGGILVRTPDQVVAATRSVEQLPPAEVAAAGGRERYARRLLRNHPEVPNSYGVLTGEAAAEDYVVTGEFAVLPGDKLVLCTDGLGSLHSADAAAGWDALGSWLQGPLDGRTLERLLRSVEATDERLDVRSDDKTVIVGVVGV